MFDNHINNTNGNVPCQVNTVKQSFKRTVLFFN